MKGTFSTQEETADRSFRVTSHPPLLPTRLKGSLFKGIECIEQKPAESRALKALNPMLGGDLLLRLGGRNNRSRIFRKIFCHIASPNFL
jgi:hypothetical protein